MISEAIDSVVELQKQASAVQIVKEWPTGELWIRKPDGTVEAREKPTPARSYKAGSQADFVGQVMHIGQRVGEAQSEGVVMFQSGNMVAVLDEIGHRLNRIVYKMQHSAAFGALCGIAGRFLSQQELAKIIRTQLADVTPTTFKTFLSNIKLSRQTETEGSIAVGSESIRRDVKAQMIGAAAVPERVAFETNVYVDHDGDVNWTENFEFALEIDYDNARMALCPVADCLSKAQCRADERVRDELDKALKSVGVRAFMGSFE